MIPRIAVLTIAALLTLAAPGAAQTAASGRATISIPDLLEVRVVESGESLRLDVAANRPWELEAVLQDGSGRSWPAGRVAEGGPGREPVILSYRRLLEVAGAPTGAMPQFTLSAR